MRAVIHYLIILPLAYLVALLPFFMLRGLAWLMYVVMYRVFAYRKKVVRNNLKSAFPEKELSEIKRIEKRFFLHLADIMLETLKMLTMSLRHARRHIRMSAESKAVVENFNNAGKSTIFAMGHYGCWEWGNFGYHASIFYELRGIYHPLSDPWFEKMLHHMRTRFGSVPVKMKDTLRHMLRHRDQVANTAFVADQSPSPHGAHWTIFLNQETGFFQGMEKIARKMNMPVVFLSLDKIKRNHYEMSFETLVADPGNAKPGEITEKYVRKLEEKIRQQPEYWLWSHRRWKHKRPEAEELYQHKMKKGEEKI